MKSQLRNALAISVLAMTVTGVAAQERPRVNLNQSQAPGITYTYAGARYIFQDLDLGEVSCEQDGINLYGSFDIQDGFFAQASFSDVSGGECGSRSFSVGGGYHTSFNSTTDMYATVSFGSMNPEGPWEDESGIELAGGMRTYLQEQLEGSVELFHNTIGDSETGVRGGLVYWFNSQFSATADLGLSADSTTFALGARMAF